MNTSINYLMIAFAFIFPISIAGANILIGLMFVLWLLEGDLKRKISVVLNEKIVLIFLLIGFFTLLSALFSHSYTDSFLTRPNQILFKTILSHFFLVPLLLIIFITSIQQRSLKLIISAFLSAIFFSEVISYLIFFQLIDVASLQNSHLLYRLASQVNPTPFMHHIAYSVFLSIAIMLLLDTLLKSKHKLFQLFISFFLLSATINLFLNGGRTGQLAFILSILTYIFFRFKINLKIISLTFMTLIFIVSLAYNTNPVFNKRINLAISDIQKVFTGNYNTSWGVRIASNKVATSYLLSTPSRFLLGAGAGDAKKEYHTYAKEHFPKEISHPITGLRHLHNQYLQYWFDGTILSFLLFILYFYLMLKIPVNNDIKPLLFSIVVIMIFVLISDNLLFKHRAFMLYMFITGYFIVQAKTTQNHKLKQT